MNDNDDVADFAVDDGGGPKDKHYVDGFDHDDITSTKHVQ